MKIYRGPVRNVILGSFIILVHAMYLWDRAVQTMCSEAEFLALTQESRILGHSYNPVCGFTMMEQVRLCAVWPMENWLAYRDSWGQLSICRPL